MEPGSASVTPPHDYIGHKYVGQLYRAYLYCTVSRKSIGSRPHLGGKLAPGAQSWVYTQLWQSAEANMQNFNLRCGLGHNYLHYQSLLCSKQQPRCRSSLSFRTSLCPILFCLQGLRDQLSKKATEVLEAQVASTASSSTLQTALCTCHLSMRIPTSRCGSQKWVLCSFQPCMSTDSLKS